MTLERSETLAPQWRSVHSATLDRTIQVRRPTVADSLVDQAIMWSRLARDGDGTPLLPPGVDPRECDATLAAEIVQLSLAHPTQARAQTG